MNYNMDYNDPIRSGKIACLRGVSRLDNPCDRRTHANTYIHWDNGWLEQSKNKCKGIVVGPSPRDYSGCIATDGDCPACGH